MADGVRISPEPPLVGFALSWDEIVVTYFTAGSQNTLPLIIFGKIRQGQELPIVNAIALFVILVSVIPVYIATRLAGSDGSGLTRDRSGPGTAEPAQ